MAYDITKKAAVETGTLELDDAAGDPMVDEKGNRLTITLYGPGSKPYVNASAKRNNKAVDRLKKKGKSELSADEQWAETAAFLAACTVSFNGWSYPPAEKLGDLHHFKAAYADPSLGFIRDQVNEFINEWGNFTGGSATS